VVFWAGSWSHIDQHPAHNVPGERIGNEDPDRRNLRYSSDPAVAFEPLPFPQCQAANAGPHTHEPRCAPRLTLLAPSSANAEMKDLTPKREQPA
jgi:hypothetical protein